MHSGPLSILSTSVFFEKTQKKCQKYLNSDIYSISYDVCDLQMERRSMVIVWNFLQEDMVLNSSLGDIEELEVLGIPYTLF
jgi:hypothetical protein